MKSINLKQHYNNDQNWVNLDVVEPDEGETYFSIYGYVNGHLEKVDYDVGDSGSFPCSNQLYLDKVSRLGK